jgi:hypothetical protein
LNKVIQEELNKTKAELETLKATFGLPEDRFLVGARDHVVSRVVIDESSPSSVRQSAHRGQREELCKKVCSKR